MNIKSRESFDLIRLNFSAAVLDKLVPRPPVRRMAGLRPASILSVCTHTVLTLSMQCVITCTDLQYQRLMVGCLCLLCACVSYTKSLYWPYYAQTWSQ